MDIKNKLVDIVLPKEQILSKVENLYWAIKENKYNIQVVNYSQEIIFLKKLAQVLTERLFLDDRRVYLVLVNNQSQIELFKKIVQDTILHTGFESKLIIDGDLIELDKSFILLSNLSQMYPETMEYKYDEIYVIRDWSTDRVINICFDIINGHLESKYPQPLLVIGTDSGDNSTIRDDAPIDSIINLY